jgi:hypothetical protein
MTAPERKRTVRLEKPNMDRVQIRIPLVTGDPFASLDMLNICQYTLRSYANAPCYGFKGPLVTSIEIDLADKTVAADPRKAWTDVATALRQRTPTAALGTYISGAHLRTLGMMTKYPPECIDTTKLDRSATLSQLSPEGDPYVNLDSQTARIAFANAISSEFKSRQQLAGGLGLNFLFLDNIQHPGAKAPYCPQWPNTLDFLTTLGRQIHNLGAKVVVNSTLSPWYAAAADIPALASAVDGLTFEMPLHPVWCRPYLDRVNREFSAYRTWLNAGMMIGLYAVRGAGQTDQDVANEQRFLAAVAMLVRDPGQAILIARPFHIPRPEWFDWPARFGAPQGPYTVVPGTPVVLKRVFANGEITVNATAASNVATSGSAVLATFH